jgi:predicted acylesterase/phospholipase RssA
VKFSGASIGALMATVAACGVHPADIWAHIPAIAKAYRGFGHLTKVG